jgi:hypothetical protein
MFNTSALVVQLHAVHVYATGGKIMMNAFAAGGWINIAARRALVKKMPAAAGE